MQVTVGQRTRSCRTVGFDAARNAVRLIDQRRLPHQFRQLATADVAETARAIADMAVRGAPAIAATAAYGLAQGARAYRGRDRRAFDGHLRRAYATLRAARPTAVDPVNAMDGMLQRLDRSAGVPDQQAQLLELAEGFAEASVAQCRALGRHGADLIADGMNLLTHCNAGWLAAVDVGTATAPLYEAQARGKSFHVYCDETRPRLQGASLTAWELDQQGISHTIIADNAAGHLLQRGRVDLVIVGADRVLGRTGEVANKIGTYTKAVLAHRHGVPFYVAIPLSTIDWELATGRDIPIEERDPEEVRSVWGLTPAGRRARVCVANPSSPALNPAFDVTPPDLITGIITPVGVFRPGDLWAGKAVLAPRPPPA